MTMNGRRTFSTAVLAGATDFLSSPPGMAAVAAFAHSEVALPVDDAEESKDGGRRFVRVCIGPNHA